MSEIICSTWNSLFESACVRADRLLLRTVLCRGVQKRHSHCVDGAWLKNLCPFYTTHSALFYMRRPCEINNSLYFDTLCRGKRARGGYWWWINYYMRWVELWTWPCLLFGEFQTRLLHFWVRCFGQRQHFCHIFNCFTNIIFTRINVMRGM